jgi:hypothetical protein
MLSQRRSRPLARPRQIAMYLAKKMTQDLYQKLEEDLLIEITQQLFMLLKLLLDYLNKMMK